MTKFLKELADGQGAEAWALGLSGEGGVTQTHSSDPRLEFYLFKQHSDAWHLVL